MRGDVKCNRTLHDEFRHAVASTSEYCRVRQYSSVPAPSLRPRPPPRILFCIPPIQFLFFGMVVARSGFSKGETDGILSANSVVSVLPNYFSGDFDLAKPRLTFSLLFVRPQKGVWGMNAGGVFSKQELRKTNAIILF